MLYGIRIKTTFKWVIGTCLLLASASSGHEVRPSILRDIAAAELLRSSPQQVCLALSELKHILLAPNDLATGLVIGDIQVDTSFSVDAIESVENLPTAPVEFVGSSRLSKYSLAAVNFFPMYYDPSTQKLVFVSSVDFELTTLQGQSSKGQWIESNIYDEFVAEHCIGYQENSDSYADLPQPPHRPDLTPELATSFTDEDVPYVIITSSSLKPHYDEYCAYKTLQGLNTKVVDLNWIRENFYYGSEIQDNIREFIRYAHLNWGTMWVLIGGDYDVVPSKDLWSMKEGGDYIISDYYYACLDGYWNLVADEYIGEVKDSVDFYPEVFIGRIPVESANEISNYLNKLRQYESDNQFTGYQEKAIFSGSLIGYPGDSKWIVDTLASLVPGSFTSEKFLEYVGDSLTDWTKEDFIESFNEGSSIYFAYGHSRGVDNIYLRKTDTLQLQASLTGADADTLSNNGKYPIIAMIGCDVNAINAESLSKSFLNNPAGGAIGFAASPARDAGYASYRYMMDMFNRTYQSANNQTIGEIATFAHLANSGFGSHFDGFTRQNLLAYMYLGDPTLFPWSDAPHDFDVTAPLLIGNLQSSIYINVEEASTPVVGARVTLVQDGELIATDTTVLPGGVSLAVNLLDDSPIEVGVFKRNYWFVIDTIAIANNRSLISVDSVIYNDDSVGLGTGNGNGNVEAGEVVRAALVLKNSGGSTLTNILCSLYTSNPLVTILRDTLTVDTILADSSVETTLGLAFEVASSTADLTFLDDLQLTILFSDTSVCCTIACGVFSGIVDLGGFTIDDDQFGSSDGDGDGVLEHLEYVEFPVIITNTGHGVLEEVWARLIPVDTQHIKFTPGVDSISYGDIPPMSGPAPPDTFEFYVVGVPSSTDMIVEVHDHYGNVDSLLFSATTNVRVPTGIDFICRNNSIRLIWTCDSLSANGGYNIYRKPEMGSYSKVNSHPIVGATIYEDDGLDENTTYFYKIAVLDLQLSESRFSPPFKTATNPPQPNFWPVNLAAHNLTPMTVPLHDTGASTTFFCYEEHILWFNSYGWAQGQDVIFQSAGTDASFDYNSLSAEDVDGDGNLEVFAPSSGSDGKLYGFEIVADTGAPEQGWPVSLPTDNHVLASPITIADVDHDGDYELFTCTQQGNVCAMNYDGTPLIGDSINFFTIPRPDTIWSWWTYSAVAVGDIDGDGEMDLVVTDSHREIYAFDLSGNVLSGFPMLLAGPSYPSSPVLADFDGDHNGMEILVNLGYQKIYLVDGDGSVLLSWPDTAFGIPQDNYTMMAASPIDVDGDNILEIVTLINNQLVVVDQQGEIQSGWPYAIYDIGLIGLSNTPLVGDIDDDGNPEILLNLGNGLIHGFNVDGTPAAGFAIEERNAGGGIPVLSDLTGHGDLYIMKGSQTIKAWQTGHDYVRDEMTWPMFQHDNHRTGSIFGTKPIIEDIDTPVAVGKEDTITVTATVDEADARWGDSLFYVWTVAKGTINGSGTTVSYIAPSYTTTDTLDLLVYDCGGNTVLAKRTMNITAGDPGEGSCPFLYVKTAEGFQQDNTVLTQSEGNVVKGQVVTDYYLTGFRPLVENGIATFDIREIEVERSYIDQVTLLQVAVPEEFDLSVSSDGEIALVSPGINIPYEAHAGDLDITSLIIDNDQFYSGNGPLDLDIEISDDYLGDSIMVDIFLLGGIKMPHGIPKPDGLADSFTPMRLASRAGSEPASELVSAPRANGSTVSFKLGNPGVGSLRLQLDWEDKAAISKLTVSPVIPHDLNVVSISPATVYLNDNDMHTEELVSEDGKFVQVMPGDILRMQFEGISDPPPGVRYEYVFKSTGYYTSFDDRGDQALLPGSPMLYPNYPNPFNPITSIPFALPSSGHVTIEVYNVLGQNVRTLLDGQVSTGFHVIQWDGQSSSGSPVASGVYYVRMQSGETVTTRNMSLVK